MRLHHHPLSPYSRKVVIAIQHRGDAIELSPIQLGSGALKRPEYLALSPFGKMPVLETDDGPIFESTSIVELLEDRGPRKLLPADRQREARHWDRIGDHYLIAPYAKLFWEAGTAEADASRKTVRTAFDLLAARLEASPFLAGDAFTFGDVGAAIAVDGLAHEGIATPRKLAAWLDRCHEIPAVRASREAAMPFIESTRPMRAVKR
jgi:glutathione S-transferase